MSQTLYKKAVEIVRAENKCSTSYIQRVLKLGYVQAADLVDELEENGVVSALNHVGKREVYPANVSARAAVAPQAAPTADAMATAEAIWHDSRIKFVEDGKSHEPSVALLAEHIQRLLDAPRAPGSDSVRPGTDSCAALTAPKPALASEGLVEALKAAETALIDLGACNDLRCAETNCGRALEKVQTALAANRAQPPAGEAGQREWHQSQITSHNKIIELHNLLDNGALGNWHLGNINAHEEALQRLSATPQAAHAQAVQRGAELFENVAHEIMMMGAESQRQQTFYSGTTEEAAQKIAAVVAQLEGRQPTWRPIETAPKDGRVILLWRNIPMPLPENGPTAWDVYAGFWCDEGKPCWVMLSEDGSQDAMTHLPPTHWMPLPPPPAANDNAQHNGEDEK